MKVVYSYLLQILGRSDASQRPVLILHPDKTSHTVQLAYMIWLCLQGKVTIFVLLLMSSPNICVHIILVGKQCHLHELAAHL